MPNLQVLPTVYRGIEFRSRLEARWAVFLSELGIGYHYEPEGYRLASGNYLPDFYIPAQDCFLEIKPDQPSDLEVAKCSELASSSGKEVFLLFGPIGRRQSIEDCDAKGIKRKWRPHLSFWPEPGVDDEYDWAECQECGAFQITWTGLVERIRCECIKSEPPEDSARLQDAFSAAASFRFHG